MANELSSTGLTTSSQSELLAQLTDALTAIYGSGINISSDTPDGQWINILVQAQLDILDLITQVYNSFDPDTAIGAVLDQRVAINGIQRQAATYTVTPITVVNTASVNLYGLDQDTQPIYTVSDQAGNRWLLVSSEIGLAAGSHSLSFRAAVPGAVLTVPNTITVQVTIVLGVSSVNNPSTYTTLGVNEESDAALRLRRQISVSLASQGFLTGLLAALQNIEGVTSAFVYENNTDVTDSDGVPSHSIWVIVAGTGAEVDIATAIYDKRNAGCGMYGTQTYNITQIDGSLFPIYWDNVVTRNLFIAFTATSIDGIIVPNIALIREDLVTDFVPGVFSEVNINGLATVVQTIDSNTLVTDAGFTDGTVQELIFSGVAASGAFTFNYNGEESGSIAWNDNLAAIQAIADAVPGMSATVTGSIASQSLTFTFTGDVSALIYVQDNTLQTVAPAAITFTYDFNYVNVLTPASKQYQFIVTEANIIILDMILTPSGQQVAPAGTVTFVALGGYGSYTYSISINNSGGSINPTTGVYTAGPTGPVNDQIKAVDRFGNQAVVTVQVT